jgi:DUF4097 and DUF4098 domain-containing protein YvlB
MKPRTFETPAGLATEIRIPSGSILVRAEATTRTRVQIHGERDPEEFRLSCEERAGGGHRLVVELRDRRKVFGWRANNLRVELTVPVGTELTCETGSADLESTGVLGSLAFRSGSGDCRFDQVETDVVVKTASGDLSGETVGGSLTFATASGDARVRDVAGDVVGNSVSGDVSVGALGGSLQVSNVSGDVDVASIGTGDANLRAVSGDIEVGVPRGTKVYLDLSSTSGDTVCELDMTDDSLDDGPADLELRANTVSGDIRIRRVAVRTGAKS